MAMDAAKNASTVRTAATAPAERGGRCQDLAPVGGPEQENFPTALRLLPKPIRRDLMAIYWYARLVDDVGDEVDGDRLALLDELERDVRRIWRGAPAHPIVGDIAATVRRHGIPPEPLLRLIEANRQDQTTARYPRFADLLAYCELSANPVGHLVLHVFGAMTPERRHLSDQICTGLQLVEHCQDVAEDMRRGRVYLPQEDLARFQVTEHDLAKPAASGGVRALVRFQTRRARQHLDRGAPLVSRLGWPARLAVAGFVGGGRAAADALAAARFDPLPKVPRPRRRRVLAHTLIAVTTGGRR
jgi:squalene synthase HpnC